MRKKYERPQRKLQKSVRRMMMSADPARSSTGSQLLVSLAAPHQRTLLTHNKTVHVAQEVSQVRATECQSPTSLPSLPASRSLLDEAFLRPHQLMGRRPLVPFGTSLAGLSQCPRRFTHRADGCALRRSRITK